MEILKGIGYCILVISIFKYIHWKWFRETNVSFDWGIWFNKNIGDYIMLIGVSFITVQYSYEIIESANYVLKKLGSNWEIIHFEDNTFYWILMPIAVPLVLGKFAKSQVRKPIVESIKKTSND